MADILGKELLKTGHWTLAGVESYENICNDVTAEKNRNKNRNSSLIDGVRMAVSK